ncbi:MAG: DUF6931 family protein [Succinivibrio sp.]
MSDKLDWLNKHYVLLQHKSVSEVVNSENYKLPFDYKDFVKDHDNSIEFIDFLTSNDMYKQACEFLSYNFQHRVLAWWAYCCVLSIREEIEKQPDKPRDIGDIGKPRELKIPEWAQPEFFSEQLNDLKDDTEIDHQIDELISNLEKKKADLQQIYESFPDTVKKRYEATRAEVYSVVEKELGMSVNDLLAKATALIEENKDSDIEDDLLKSPIFKAEKDLKEKIEKIRTEAVKNIKDALPKKSEEEMLFNTSNAINSAYAFIVAPNELNARNCMAYGNLCPDTPEGMLALVCFWSYGNLNPDPLKKDAMVIKTPVGLASNGFNSLINLCSLAKGGYRKPNERIEHYFKIGQEIGFGVNNWSEYLSKEIPPHEDKGEDRFTGFLDMNFDEEEENCAEEKDKAVQKIAPPDDEEKFNLKTSEQFTRFKF